MKSTNLTKVIVVAHLRMDVFNQKRRDADDLVYIVRFYHIDANKRPQKAPVGGSFLISFSTYPFIFLWISAASEKDINSNRFFSHQDNLPNRRWGSFRQ